MAPRGPTGVLDNCRDFCQDSEPVPIPIVDVIVTELFRSKLSDSGRVVIPAELRRVLKLLDGEEVVFLRDGDAVRLLSRHAAILAAQSIGNRPAKDTLGAGATMGHFPEECPPCPSPICATPTANAVGARS